MIKLRKITICLSILALSLITTTASADETKKDRLIYSLDTGIGITGDRGNVGTPLQQDYDVAIRINDKKFVGMTIAAVRVNPAKRNVLDLKNETCKNREKRNVLKISRTRHFKATKKQSRTGCFYSF